MTHVSTNMAICPRQHTMIGKGMENCQIGTIGDILRRTNAEVKNRDLYQPSDSVAYDLGAPDSVTCKSTPLFNASISSQG